MAAENPLGRPLAVSSGIISKNHFRRNPVTGPDYWRTNGFVRLSARSSTLVRGRRGTKNRHPKAVVSCGSHLSARHGHHREVRATDRALEQNIPNQGEACRVIDENDMAGRVSRAMQNIETMRPQKDMIALL